MSQLWAQASANGLLGGLSPFLHLCSPGQAAAVPHPDRGGEEAVQASEVRRGKHATKSMYLGHTFP